MWRGRHPKESREAEPQLVAVAVTDSRSSQSALKWAADHLISKGQVFLLLHVRRMMTSIPTPSGQQIPLSEVDEDVASAFIEEMNQQTKDLLLPFQCLCSRRGLQCKEVILEENDAAKAITDYVTYASVDKLVLGATSRNAFTRAFKQADVPTSVLKIAPDFCSVYIISKGKLSSDRPASSPNRHPGMKQLTSKFESSRDSFQSTKSDPYSMRTNMEDFAKSPFMRGARNYDDLVSERFSRFGKDAECLDFSYQSVTSCPSPTRSLIEHPIYHARQGHVDSGAQQSTLFFHHDEQLRSLESSRSGGSHDDQMRSPKSSRSSWPSWSNGSRSGISSIGQLPSGLGTTDADGDSCSSNSLDDMDSEIGKIKLELRQKIAIYSGTCQGTLNTKARNHYFRPAKKEHGSEGTRSSDEMAVQKPIRAVPELAQASKDVANLEETMGGAERKYILEEEEKKKKLLESLSKDIRYRRYTLEEIEKATNHFSEELKIGEGGYGPVFKATLDHTLVAVKILRSNVSQGMKQFQQEIEVLSCIRHPNMVLLMGACPESGCLVYEYMANGSLEDRLFCKDNTPPLSWQLRFKIASEIATGLLFLHQNKPEPLVHRDLKPGNILLDKNFVSKIADVGLARLIPPSIADAVTQYRMTAAAGTFCYIDPEYQKTGMLGIKSDVYALGIILLQLITGRAPMGLAHNIEMAIEDRALEKMLDPKVPDWPMEETMKFAELALRISQKSYQGSRTIYLGDCSEELNRAYRKWSFSKSTEEGA
ncbi:hypothetical protein MRB53_029825 [Persea americana]|uniref:Uncharacterized protein n=1 Tax=Persea americana TaxID=3435 RepID=A0ACC2KJH4_PERAE|nr:hypothetical protein MRB53_029825 [Persea americana]